MNSSTAHAPFSSREAEALESHYRPGFAVAFGRLMHAVNRVWFRFSLRGQLNVPNTPCLFVGNHSGIGIADVLCLLGGWLAHTKGRRRFVGMMHKMFIQTPVVGHIAAAFGAVPANPDNAKAALRRGYDVATFPGGDLDSCRPFTEARRVVFGGRRGYVRLALETGVPIVPVATIGSHFTYTLLPGGAAIARITRMKQWGRCEKFPLVLGTLVALLVAALALANVVPWWLVPVAVLLALVPNPVRVTSAFLPPIDVTSATAHITNESERIEAAHAMVHEALSKAVATMQHAPSTETEG